MRPSQTLVKTGTGIWEVTYNALNRPTCFTRTNADNTVTTVTAAYDYMGRRVFKKVEENGVTTLHQRYLYRGYLLIAALDLTRPTLNALWFITWDPTEPVATRPLAIQQSGTWYSAPTRPAAPGSPSQECSGLGVWLLKPHPAYGLDLPKNVTEVYDTNGYIVTAYTYSPYGLVTAIGSVTQSIQWSCEFADADLGMVYYNYRHYNPPNSRWTGRDPRNSEKTENIFGFAENSPVLKYDVLGLVAEKQKCKILLIWGHGSDVSQYMVEHKHMYDLATSAFGPLGCFVEAAPKGLRIEGFPNLKEGYLGIRDRGAEYNAISNANQNSNKGNTKKDRKRGFCEVMKAAYGKAVEEANRICKSNCCEKVTIIFSGIGARSGKEGTRILNRRFSKTGCPEFFKGHGITFSSNWKKIIPCKKAQKPKNKRK